MENEVDKPTFEYEFTFMWEGKPMFCGVWDTNDRSACERILCHPVKAEDITLSDTGNGFVVDKHGHQWAFHKEPYVRSWEHGEIGVHPDELRPPPSRSRKQAMSADSILAGL